MIKSELLKDKGVLIVSPVGPLAASDFERLAQEVDSYIEQNGRLHGLMVHAEFFPGWADFAAFLLHLKFVKDHQSKIEKVAAVSDSGFLRIIPSVALDPPNARRKPTRIPRMPGRVQETPAKHSGRGANGRVERAHAAGAQPTLPQRRH